jgi:glycosyltransferase involved in cell wall biosynthesis
MGKGTTIDRNITKNVMKQIVSAIGKKQFPKIHLVHGNMESSEIAALYHHPSIKCFVSATRGEGYGLPIIDAAASGLPVIATNWSGHLEFLEDESFLPVDYELKEIHKTKIDNRIFLEGFKWAEPKKDSFNQQVDLLMKNYNEIKLQSKNYSKKVVAKFHKEQVKKMYDKILDEVLK